MNVMVSNRQRLLKVDVALLKRITEFSLASLNSRLDDVSIALVDDAGIAKLNTQFHATDGPTDVLSFNYGEGQGEIILSVEHARRQSRRYSTSPAREVALYLVHGILHLHGLDDRTVVQRRRMRAAERRLLANLARNHCVQRLAVRRAK